MKTLTQIFNPTLKKEISDVKTFECAAVRFLERHAATTAEYRKRASTTMEIYGLPYTSCSGYGALWVTNSPVFYEGLSVDGIAVTTDNRLCMICTEDQPDGEKTRYFIEVNR